MTYKLSPSRINLFFECRRCFWLRVNENVKRPSGPFPSLLSGMDAAIKNHFDRFRKRGEKPPELEEMDLEPFPDLGFLELARDWRTEPKWEDPETGTVLRGGVDDLLLSKDDRVVVMDYKTRGYPPKQRDGAPDYYERQVNLYNLILRENGRETEDYGIILYYYPDRILANGDIVFYKEYRKTPVDIEKAKETVREAVKILENDIPPHNEDCDFCEWSAE
ncbi:MAG: PD-(D/E)XK nuclease family protein [Candidatus Nanohaloarchaea archaeon]